MIYTVKGFGIINKAEIYFFINRVNSITVLIEEMQSLSRGFPGDSDGKESAHNSRELGSIPGLGRYPGEGNGYPLQYSGLENSMDWRATVDGVAESDVTE